MEIGFNVENNIYNVNLKHNVLLKDYEKLITNLGKSRSFSDVIECVHTYVDYVINVSKTKVIQYLGWVRFAKVSSKERKWHRKQIVKSAQQRYNWPRIANSITVFF